MIKIKDISDYLEIWAPIPFQEEYDNAGLIVGDNNWTVNSILLTLDVTEEVIDEAKVRGANLIIAHHPIIFKGIKKLNGKSYIERAIIKAIKNDIAIYAIHTNLDHVVGGVNWKIGERLKLNNLKILSPKVQNLLKLVTYCPVKNYENVAQALFAAGAGKIGNYQNCIFKSEGWGSFLPLENAKPAIGMVNKYETVEESRIEVILPSYLQNAVLEALKKAHPYEEVSYYFSKLENENQEVGAGAIGELEKEMDEIEFLAFLKESMDLNIVKYTPVGLRKINKVALCGGSGSFLLQKALAAGADAFVTADFKYHEYFDSEGQILIADIGHYESEVYTKDLLYFQLSKKFTNFAILLSEIDTNPIKYYF